MRYTPSDDAHQCDSCFCCQITKEPERIKVDGSVTWIDHLATPAEMARYAENESKEEEAIRICREKIRKHNLGMKLVTTHFLLGEPKVIFFFTADERVDFRDLVKDLVSVFRMRIELRQIGVRDESRLIGGLSVCGRDYCCHLMTKEMDPVTIKMAKEQNLSLNPSKISGVCGRLMCCLKNEEETYEVLNSRLPSPGDYVTTNDGLKGEVHSVNVLRQLVKVVVVVDKDEKEIREYRADQLKFKPRKKKGSKGKEKEKERNKEKDASDEELKKLEALEKKERKSKLDD